MAFSLGHGMDGGNQDRYMASRRIGMFGVEPSELLDDKNEDGVAALLRRRREELSRDITTVARQLRIRAVYIQAIEDGRLQDLPGTAYAVGFVRAYADYLGLDGNSIVSDYRDELARRSRQNQLIWPVDQVEHKHFPGGIILIVSLVLAVVLYGGWYFASQPGGTGIDLIDKVPELMKQQGEEAAPAEQGSAVPTEAASGTTSIAGAETGTPAATPAATPSSAQASSPAVSDPAPAVVPEANVVSAPVESPAIPLAPVASEPGVAVDATAPFAPTAAPDTAGDVAAVTAPLPAGSPAAPLTGDSESAPVEAPSPGTENLAAANADPVAAEPERRIVLRASKDSWVEIFDAQQEVILQRILRAGETYAVPDLPGLIMNTGNAGGLVIEVDGRAQPSLGSIGVVKRGVALDPELLSAQ
ncbi:MAG: DUF4115 domain-containing protein [Rhodospirillaceae bacterium]|nr:DUF4115 domain-containing protein [Rhodospirillaceae bacterium]